MKKIEMLVSDDDSEMGANSQPPTVQDSSQPATSGEVKELIEEHVRHHYRKSLKLTSEQIVSRSIVMLFYVQFYDLIL